MSKPINCATMQRDCARKCKILNQLKIRSLKKTSEENFCSRSERVLLLKVKNGSSGRNMDYGSEVPEFEFKPAMSNTLH